MREKFFNHLKNKKGEGDYIEVCVVTICLVGALVFFLNVYSFFSLRSQMGEIAEQVIDYASINGGFDDKFEARVEQLKEQFSNVDFTVTYGLPEGETYFDEDEKTVQYGDVMYITVNVEHHLTGLGIINDIPINCSVSKSSVSKLATKTGGITVILENEETTVTSLEKNTSAFSSLLVDIKNKTALSGNCSLTENAKDIFDDGYKSVVIQDKKGEAITNKVSFKIDDEGKGSVTLSAKNNSAYTLILKIDNNSVSWEISNQKARSYFKKNAASIVLLPN